MQQIITRDTKDERIFRLYQQLDTFFLENGFKEENINGEINFVRKNLYCVPICVQSLGFFIDYAHSLADAQNHLHSDGDAVPLSERDEVILATLKEEILSSMK